jgi:RNA polymerase sigma factor FliA
LIWQTRAARIGEQPEREAMVRQLYLVEELNLEEIGQTLGVGAARVCQIKKAALDRLRKSLAEWG